MDIVRMFVPFSNEVANVLTSSGLAIFSGLYKDVPKTKKQKLSKVLIDLIALIGIILNAVHTTEKHGSTAGIIKGIIVIIIAFFNIYIFLLIVSAFFTELSSNFLFC